MQVVRNEKRSPNKVHKCNAIKALLSSSKLSAQTEERCVYAKSGAQVNGLTMM